jgi:hypothetical protein
MLSSALNYGGSILGSNGSSHPGAMKAHQDAEFNEKYGVWDPMPELTI